MKHLRAFVGYGMVTYIELVLKEIQLSREIFMMEIVLGNDTIIPRQLRSNGLSMSYRFYDSIISSIQDQMSKKIIDNFALRFDLNIKRIQDDSNLLKKISQMLGIGN